MNEITRTSNPQYSTVSGNGIEKTSTTLESPLPIKKSAQKIQSLIPTTRLNDCSIPTSKKRSRATVKKKSNVKTKTAKKLKYRTKSMESKTKETLPKPEIGAMQKTKSLFQKATSKEENREIAMDEMTSRFNNKLSFSGKPKINKSTINMAIMLSAKILEQKAKSIKDENERIIILEHYERGNRQGFFELDADSEDETPSSKDDIIIKIMPYGYKEVVSKKDLILLSFSELGSAASHSHGYK